MSHHAAQTQLSTSNDAPAGGRGGDSIGAWVRPGQAE